jgi:hypothetical protein
MRELVAKLLDFDDVNRFIGEMTSGLSTRYDLGSELDDVGRLIGDKAIRHGDADVSLYEVMQDGMGVLLDASSGGKLSELAAASARRIRCVVVDQGSFDADPARCLHCLGRGGERHRWIEGSAPPLVRRKR